MLHDNFLILFLIRIFVKNVNIKFLYISTILHKQSGYYVTCIIMLQMLYYIYK